MKWIYNSVLILAAATLLVVALYLEVGDEKVLRIGSEKFTFLKTNDQLEGGTSTSELLLEGGSKHLACELNKSHYRWPYCGISIRLSDDVTQGLDLSTFHTLRIRMAYETPEGEPLRQVRLYLRNFNPAYSSVEDDYTHKYNGIQFAPGEHNGRIDIPLKNLQVMTWWLADNKIPIEHAGPEFSNVNRIEIATGSGAQVGIHDLHFYSIELVGEYVKAEDLFLCLLIVWIVVGAVISLLEIDKGRQKVAEIQAREQHLADLNNSLQIEKEQFAEQAHRDALTGAMNRYGVNGWLREQSNAVRWGGTSLSVLYLDIDFFKAINDTYGHKVGDDILREFVMVVRSSTDCMDRIVRWGGEEFILFSPETNLCDAQKKAERIRQKVESHQWVHGRAMTCCIGVAQMGDERTSETLARADEALYKAKANGRNRVETNYGLVKREDLAS
ncbi:GGDEF domain-containing protein [Vibrio maerlii]|uniref:GGDEF domain-containing protein n=1 Tax=Vibrio maerlii TaxID=2231648 RepID=UPI000E3C0F47|nr:GGDEF domain-containing protein [Vibrio maerlii]